MIRLNDSYPKQIQTKNRSSKHLKCLVGKENKSILRCVSIEQLQKWVNMEVRGAKKELDRRLARQERRAANKAK